jgi:hypothetical protein
MLAERSPSASTPATLDPRPSLDWLTANLSHIVAQPDGAGSRGTAKRCTELALAHAYLRTWVADGSLPAQPFAGHLDAWRDALRAHCDALRGHCDALARPLGGLYRAQPYLWLRAAGDRMPACERELARLARGGARADSVGVLHCLWKAGVLSRPPDWRAALVRWLAAWGDDDRSLDHSAYRVTHAAFYITDFGNDHAPVRPADRERLAALAERLLERWLPRERWDLVGELLIALACLHSDGSPHSEGARAFAAARAAGELTQDDRDEPFCRRYHVTVVDALRCAVGLRGSAAMEG